MKRGIETWTEYDRAGRYCIRIKKKKGKLSLAEIRDIIREAHDWDLYFLFMDCMNDDEPQFDDAGSDGDFVTLYATDAFTNSFDEEAGK